MAVTTLPAGRFDLEETEERVVLRRRKSPARLVPIACALVALSAAVPLVAGAGGIFAPIFPGILLTLAIFVQTNQIAGRGVYFRLARELVVERAAGGGYRDARAAPRLAVDGRPVAGDVRDVVVRATAGPQPAWQVYVLLADGGLVHVTGSVSLQESAALRAALRSAMGLAEDRTPPAPDAVSFAALGILLVLLIAHICGLVMLAIEALAFGRQGGPPVLAGALAAGGVLLSCAVFAGAIAVLVRPALRSWVRAVHRGR